MLYSCLTGVSRYPIYTLFLSSYLAEHGADKVLSRCRTMTVAALCAAAFAGAFTRVRNEPSNVAFLSMINFWQNAFYGTLWA